MRFFIWYWVEIGWC